MNFNVTILSYDDKEECYDGFVDCLLSNSLEHINDELDKGKVIYILYETMIGLGKREYKGFDNVFKLPGLIEIMNNYFVKSKSNLVAIKGSHNNKNVIKISRFEVKDVVKEVNKKNNIEAIA